jgi:hypothetical protein
VYFRGCFQQKEFYGGLFFLLRQVDALPVSVTVSDASIVSSPPGDSEACVPLINSEQRAPPADTEGPTGVRCAVQSATTWLHVSSFSDWEPFGFLTLYNGASRMAISPRAARKLRLAVFYG